MKKSRELEEFISTIFLMSEKPGIFAMSNSDEIYHFMQGYYYASNDEIKDFISNFRSYVNTHFLKNHFTKTADFEMDWKNWIRFLSSTNHESIKLFATVFKNYVDSID